MGVSWNTQIRINDPSTLDRDQIEKELHRGKHVIVQISHPSFYGSMLPELNELCVHWDENLGVRFYGHYSLSLRYAV